MITLIKLIFCSGLLFTSFFAGVKYSDEAKEVANWIFEEKEKEITLEEIKDDIKNNPDDIESDISDMKDVDSDEGQNDLESDEIDAKNDTQIPAGR